MRRALVAAIVLVSGRVAADEPTAEDPKAAIAERGIVLKAGKRHFFVIVPATTLPRGVPPDSKLRDAEVYFGDAKKLFHMLSSGIKHDPGHEDFDVADPRDLFDTKLTRDAERYQLTCEDRLADDKRTFALAPADAKTVASLAKASIQPLNVPYRAMMLARLPNSTTYLYVDRRGANGDHRLFLGKRGALKQLPVKDAASEDKSLILVTAKGTLAATLSGDRWSATWGPAKKPAAVDVIPIWPNRKLIYRELGVYTRDRTGHPCDEL